MMTCFPHITFESRINRILGLVRIGSRPVRDTIWVETLLIVENLPEVNKQYQLNEQIRARIAKPQATLDTLIKVARFEFNPNWTNPIFYNTNAYNSLNETGLIENLKDSLKAHIKNYYNGKFYRIGNVTNITMDYRKKVSEYVETYTFGSTSLHDQGPLIDALVWNEIEPGHLAATFQGISNFKRLLFRITKSEMEYSINNSRLLIQHIDDFLEKRGQDGF